MKRKHILFGALFLLGSGLLVAWGLRADSQDIHGGITAISCVQDGTYGDARIDRVRLHCVVAVCRNGTCYLEDVWR
jgi:hypothetical protein